MVAEVPPYPDLPTFSPYRTAPAQFVDVFNRGATPFTYEVTTSVPWLRASAPSGRVEKETRVTFTVDWSRAPAGTTQIPITITGAGQTVTVQAVVDKPAELSIERPGFVEANGYVSMEAEHDHNAVAANGITWLRIPDIGRTGSGMTTSPATSATQRPGDGPRLDYRFNLTTTGPVTVWVYLVARNDTSYHDGLRYAVSLDDQVPQIVNMTAGVNFPNQKWEMNAVSSVNRTATKWTVSTQGEHVLRYWMVDPTLTVQKIVIDTGGLKDTYLGPPESFRR